MGVGCDGSRGWMRLVDYYYWCTSLRSLSTSVEPLSTSGVTYARVCGQLMAYTYTSVQVGVECLHLMHRFRGWYR